MRFVYMLPLNISLGFFKLRGYVFMKIDIVQLKKGIKDGLPIGLGYLPIAFTVGMGIISKGFSIITNALFSLSVSAMATITTTNLMSTGESCLGIFLALFLLNLRHIVLSLALSQRLETNVPLWKKFFVGIGITDENFALAIRNKGEISADYYIGVTVFPWITWVIGAILGSIIGNILPDTLTIAMSMAIYGMLLYALVPSAKESRPALYTIVIAGIFSTLFKWVRPYFLDNKIISFLLSPSISLVLGAILSAAVVAAKFPKKVESV